MECGDDRASGGQNKITISHLESDKKSPRSHLGTMTQNPNSFGSMTHRVGDYILLCRLGAPTNTSHHSPRPGSSSPRQLHSGVWLGMRVVPGVQDEKSDDRLVVKFRGEDSKRWEKEIRLYRILTHPNLVPLVETCDEYVVLKYANGGDLTQYLNKLRVSRNGRRPESCLVGLSLIHAHSIFVQLVQAIRYLHSQGFVHRDLKPENVFVHVCPQNTNTRREPSNILRDVILRRDPHLPTRPPEAQQDDPQDNPLLDDPSRVALQDPGGMEKNADPPDPINKIPDCKKPPRRSRTTSVREKSPNAIDVGQVYVWLGDFGMTCKWREGHLKNKVCGTDEYMDPCLLSDKVHYEGPELDCWGLGVVLYYLLHGKGPFSSSSPLKTRKKIKCGKYRWTRREETKGSDLVDKLLQVERSERATLDEILNHPYLVSPSAEKISPRPLKKASSAPQFTLPKKSPLTFIVE
jgi:serine/threonine protein kinase